MTLGTPMGAPVRPRLVFGVSGGEVVSIEAAEEAGI